ncbi:DUF4393 domain-containing protein [Acinetobacter schindleri]|uniref:DUF4393 domain-containing protein n=1 Tax=Acinetobacter schindleri TaxID=108981 RepID=UPI00209B42D1|nr:DUF4393 domain-containing protein [Acinetobacter schindleri]MCO8066663.1 DUF4393 domain-containing protein [Acinetobacter schindleri]
MNTCLSPIKYLNEKTELNRQNNLNELAKRFNEIPLKEIVEAAPEIAVPIAEKLVYISDETLRKMYIELLAKASTKACVQTAHPSFINIINNLSPDEGNLIKIFFEVDAIPFVSYKSVNKDDESYHFINELVIKIPPSISLNYPNNRNVYLHNLESLGLIRIITSRHLSGESTYQHLVSEFEICKNAYKESNRILKFEKGGIQVTELGKMFFENIKS